MPTYEFRCPNGHVFDRFFGKISEAPSDVTCPDCGETAHRQISGGAGLVFKGSGFYLTDYGKNAHRGSAPKSSASESKSGDSASSGGDSKSGGEKGPKAESGSSGSAKAEAESEKPSAKTDTGNKSSGGSTT